MFTDLCLWQIEARRSSLLGDVWHDGDEIGDQLRQDLDALIEEVTRLRALEKSLKQTKLSTVPRGTPEQP